MRTVIRTTCLGLSIFALSAYGQNDSASNGSDGALILTAPGTVVFDPQNFHPSINAKGDQIYNFSSIIIGAGVTVKLSGHNLHGPIFWLSSGPVQIDGTIDLDGDDSQAYSSGAPRIPAAAGAGGHAGGVGSLNGNDAQPGLGPGWGTPNQGGDFTGNKLLVPLLGGSGGGGSAQASGGGGGGALLIASSSSITLNGTISANGGNQRDPGFLVTGGSGGAIRLVAPLITGSGALLTAKGGAASGGAFSGQDGRIRLEAYENTLRGDVNSTPLSIGKPLKLFLPSDASPLVKVIAIGNTSVSDTLPKITVSEAKQIIVALEAQNVPPGTAIKVHFYSDNGKDQTLESTKLVGTFQLSHATVTVPLAGGLTHLAIDASWPLPALAHSRAEAHGQMKASLDAGKRR